LGKRGGLGAERPGGVVGGGLFGGWVLHRVRGLRKWGTLRQEGGGGGRGPSRESTRGFSAVSQKKRGRCKDGGLKIQKGKAPANSSPMQLAKRGDRHKKRNRGVKRIYISQSALVRSKRKAGGKCGPEKKKMGGNKKKKK